MKIAFLTIFAAALLSASVGASESTGVDGIRLGILNTVGNETSEDKFRKSIESLDRVWDRPVVVSYYDIPELYSAIKNNKVDFFLSNAGVFSTLESAAHARHLASLKIKEAADVNESMGGIFFVRRDSGIKSFADMKGKTAAAVSPRAFGGYLVSLGEILARGENPEPFFSKTSFLGYPMQLVFDEIREGKADVGLVRACLLEEMIARGELKPDEFRVIAGKRDGKLACVRSTDLYPAWVFAATPLATAEESKQAAVALLTHVEPSGVEWSIASDFRSIRELYKALKVEQYLYLRNPTIKDFIYNHRMALSLLSLFFVCLFLHYLLVNAEVKKKTQSLRAASEAREKAQEKTMAMLRRLHALERISLVGMLSNTVAHELKQPIGTIANFADGIRTVNRVENPDRALIDEAVEEILQQTCRANAIIERVRSYAKPTVLKLERIRISELVKRATLDLQELGLRMPELLDKVPEDITVNVDRVEMTLVLLNLLRNAVEAVVGVPEARVSIVASDDGHHVTIMITDNGPTTDVSDLQYLFAPKASTKAGGLGIGLAIAARMIERFRGTLSIVANQPHGVCAKIVFPSVASEMSDDPRN